MKTDKSPVSKEQVGSSNFFHFISKLFSLIELIWKIYFCAFVLNLFTGKHQCQSQPADSACNFIKKETLAQVFSCEFCVISKKTVFYRTPPGGCFRIFCLVVSWKITWSDTSNHSKSCLNSVVQETLWLSFQLCISFNFYLCSNRIFSKEHKFRVFSSLLNMEIRMTSFTINMELNCKFWTKLCTSAGKFIIVGLEL